MENLNKFWAVTADVWKNGVFGFDIGKIAAALAILAGFLLVRHLFTHFVIARLKRLASKTKTNLDDKLIEALEGPIRFIPIVLGVFFASQYLELAGGMQTLADGLVRSLIAFTIFWAFYQMVAPLSFLLRRLEKVFTPEMVDWLVKAIRMAFVFLGAMSILEIWGIQVGPIIAGLGLFGVAVALGAQDLFKNLIAGVLVIGEKRFKKGDSISVDGVVTGTVENIGFRSTLVRRYDKVPVYVPNSKLSDSAVTNLSERTHRRLYWKVGVEYSSSVEQLRAIRDGIENYITGRDEFAKPPEVSTYVRIDGFSDSSIDIMLYCFTKTTDWGEFLEIKERLAYAIKDVVEGAGSAFAFPSQSIYVETVPGETPEVFTPQKKTNKQ